MVARGRMNFLMRPLPRPNLDDGRRRRRDNSSNNNKNRRKDSYDDYHGRGGRIQGYRGDSIGFDNDDDYSDTPRQQQQRDPHQQNPYFYYRSEDPTPRRYYNDVDTSLDDDSSEYSYGYGSYINRPTRTISNTQHRGIRGRLLGRRYQSPGSLIGRSQSPQIDMTGTIHRPLNAKKGRGDRIPSIDGSNSRRNEYGFDYHRYDNENNTARRQRSPPTSPPRGTRNTAADFERRDDFNDDYRHRRHEHRDGYSETSPVVAVDHINGSIHAYDTRKRDWFGRGRDNMPPRSSEGSLRRPESMTGGSSTPSSVGNNNLQQQQRRKYRGGDMSWSSDTISSYQNWRMEYAGARPSSNLPRGYMRRKDGVILSVAESSNGTISDLSERYVDPEVAAQNVIENLKSFGYEYSEAKGINFSDSTSTRADRYVEMQHKKTNKRSRNIQSNSNLCNQNSESKQIDQTNNLQTNEPIQRHQPEQQLYEDQEGSVLSLVKSFEEANFAICNANNSYERDANRLLNTPFPPKATGQTNNELVGPAIDNKRTHGKPPIPPSKPSGRAKVKATTKLKNDPLGNGSVNSNETSSSGSVFRAKAAVGPPKNREGSGSVSMNSKSSKSDSRYEENRQLQSSTEVKFSPQPGKTSPPTKPVVKGFDVSRIAEDTFSKGDTRQDESTISTKEQQPGVVTQPNYPCLSQARTGSMSLAKTGITDRAVFEGEQGSHHSHQERNASTRNRKSVGFCGEMPPPTKAGGRVPEMIARLPSPSSVSDISSLPRSGQSGSTTIPFEGTAVDKMERFLEQMVLTCRLSLFHPTYPPHSS